MSKFELDILWEGEIQACALDKKKVWRPRTKDMQGSLTQYSDSTLKLDMSVDIVKLADKRTLPASEEIDLSNVTFISDMIHSRECKEFFFFCQCIKLNADGEEEIVINTFKTELDEVRRRFMEAIFEYMQRRAIKQPSNYFNVIIEKEVKTADFKLYGEYWLRTTDTGIEFLISENIPGIALGQADINSAKILEDSRPDVGEHVIDLIMRGLNNNYHIIMKSKGGHLLLIYLQRGLDNCMQEIFGNRPAINSLPISEFSVHTPAFPPIPPKPDSEAKPPLPPRSACSHSEASAFEFQNSGKARFDRGDSRGIPPLPPRHELAASPNLLQRGNNAMKAMTLPHGLRANFSQNELKLSRMEQRRASDNVPPLLPERNFFSTLPRAPHDRSPMPLPEEEPILSEIRIPSVEIKSASISYDGTSPSTESDPEEPQYAEIKFGEEQLNVPEVPTKTAEECPYVTPNPVNEEDLAIDVFKENQKNRKRGFYKKLLCPTSIKISPLEDENRTYLECETPVSEVIDDPDYVDVLSPTQDLNESGYLCLIKPDLDQMDSLGYVTVREAAKSPPSPTKRKLSGNIENVTPVSSPVVPPRGYRDFIKN